MWALLFVMGCTGTDDARSDVVAVPSATEGPAVVVSASHPVGYLVERLAGDLVEHRALLPEGMSAGDWAPDASVVLDLQRADRIVLNGAGLEAWVNTVSLSPETLVDLSKAAPLIEREGAVHSHGKGGAHSHREVDPRVWTDPAAYREQAVALHAALVGLGGADRATLDANLAALTNDLDAVHAELQEASADLNGLRLIAAQPSFAYLTRQYGIDTTAIALSPTDEGQDLAAFEQATAAQAFSVVLWADEPSNEVRQRFSERVRHVVLDDLSSPTDAGYDYMVQARVNASVLAQIVPDEI